MCFNATASFVGAAVVGGIGVVSLTRVRRPRELIYASLPLAFAVHQFLEGWTWRELGNNDVLDSHGWAVHLWVLYAWALLPLWVPLGVWLLETDRRRRRRLVPVMALGGVMLVGLLPAVISGNLKVLAIDNSLDYVLPYAGALRLIAPYVLCTCVGPMLSSWPWVRIFGIANVAAVAFAALIEAAAFASIWCTMAAFLSALVLIQLNELRRDDRVAATPTPKPSPSVS